MKSLSLSTAAVLTLALGLAAPSFAQTPTTTTTDTWRMPYERGFWGHAGISAGRGDLDASCPAGFGCDLRDQVWRAYAGGRFNNAIGLELGAINIGDYSRGGGVTNGWGLDFALVAGVPFGANSAIFGKLGAIYARTDVSGVASPGFATGKEQDLGLRYGVGAQIGFTPKWALRADWDRYDLPLPGGREDLDVFMLGVQYTFR